jgi:uncharacterized RDD family membrane protein YckC
MLDTCQTLETPEAIDLELHLAGPISRMLAYGIDVLLRLIAQAVLYFSVALVSESVGWGIWMILMFVMEWFYPVLFEMFNHGKTPGKALFGLRVIQQNGTPITWSASIIRNLLRVVDILPFGYAFGLFSMAMTQRFQRLGDLAAGTLVIYHQVTKPPRLSASSKPEPPPSGLDLVDQKALISFSERQTTLTHERQRELANHLAVVLDARDDDAVKRINGISRWLLGER